MCETEITQAQWRMLMGYNPSNNTAYIDGLPVENVSWNAVQRYIKVLNDSTGKHYRLPTEAEWEYAARGGNKSKGYAYSGSNYIDDVAWHYLNSDGKTHPVALKKPNELGLYDMSGNVLEWCDDWYDPANNGAYPSADPQKDPKGPSEVGKSSKINRGGWFAGTAMELRVSRRQYYNGGKTYESKKETIGFRLVLPVE